MTTHGKSNLTNDPGEILAVLGDPTRRTIIESLRESPKPVVELARAMPISRPAVSQHLKVLKDAGLVTDRPEANRRIYSLNPAALAPLMAYLEGFWTVGLANYALAARPAKPGRDDDGDRRPAGPPLGRGAPAAAGGL